jgi:hypothetical protein
MEGFSSFPAFASSPRDKKTYQASFCFRFADSSVDFEVSVIEFSFVMID